MRAVSIWAGSMPGRRIPSGHCVTQILSVALVKLDGMPKLPPLTMQAFLASATAFAADLSGKPLPDL